MAGEVDFGDHELFEQLDAEEVTPASAQEPRHTRFDETEELRERLRGCEETVRALQAENILAGKGSSEGGKPAFSRFSAS